MTCKLVLSVYRFNTETDYLPYYKKYTISIDTDKTVADLLGCVKEEDPLFDFPTGDGIAVKINGKTLFTTTKVEDVIEALGKELLIESLKEKRSIKDLIINTDDFYGSFDLLSPFVEKVDRASYEKLIHLHYASEALEYNEEYQGAGLFVFAYDMIQKYPHLKADILKIIANERNGIWYHTPLTHHVLGDVSEYETKIDALKGELLALTPAVNSLVEKELARAESF